MKNIKILTVYLFCMILFCAACHAAASVKPQEVFPSPESKDAFAKDISEIVGGAWKKWQDSVIINGIDVEGSRGLLKPGDISEPALTSASMLKDFSRQNKSQKYIACIRAVTGAVENGMRSWQHGYYHDNILFPQGASCAYTLPPCNNVPVIISTGASRGDEMMTEQSLYSYMLYHAPGEDKSLNAVFKAASKAIADGFKKWKNSCSIVDILATGGIAPAPAPMGTGPGPVRGAKGNNGKLIGAYFDSTAMYESMVESLGKQKQEVKRQEAKS